MLPTYRSREASSFNWVTWASVRPLTTCVETRISSTIRALHVKRSSIFWRAHPEQTRKQMWKCLLADFIKLFIFFLFLRSLKETRVSQAANELSLFLLKMRISDARYPISTQRFIFPRTSMRAVSKTNMRNYRAGSASSASCLEDTVGASGQLSQSQLTQSLRELGLQTWKAIWW